MASNIVLSNTEYKVVGTRPIRHDGTDKVTGRAKYGGDFQASGMLHGKVLRSPHAHARIRSIDVSRALALPGVKAAITGQDMPVARMENPDQDLRFASDNLLARGKVLYKGHAVAAVAATSPHIADTALGLIDVVYEVLPPVTNVREAMKEGSTFLHDDLTTRELGEQTGKLSNVASHLRYEKGDVDKGFGEADITVEHEYTTATVHQGYIEPQNASALWNADGRLTVWCSTQGAFTAREDLAKVLDVPVSRIKMVPMEIGGGFGGKINIYLEPLAALLSAKTGKPVKIVMSRSDVFEGTGPTSGTYIKVKMGVTKAGKLTAGDAYLVYEAGSFPGAMVDAGGQCMFAPYDLENARVDGYDVVVNKPKTAAYRAPAAPNAAFAVETVVDELAEKVGMDPVEFRLLNASKEGTRRVDGPRFRRIGNVECLEAAKASEHYLSPLEGPWRGRGVASGFWFNIGFQSSCSIAVNADGTVSLVEGSTDIGGTRVSIAMQAAEVLGIPAEDVHPSVGDTESVGYTFLTGGSRTTFATGWAAYECAQDISAKMVQRASKIWDVPLEDVALTGGVFRHKSDPDLRLTFKELAERLNDTGGPISSQVSVNPKGVGGAFTTHIVDVEVDPDTGKVAILNYTAVQDAGKAIHPAYVEGQIQGGVAQGIGWALNEEYFFDGEGRMLNASFLDYRMPIALDLPLINTIIVEVANPGHPFGVRGVGEAPIIPPMAAIANAIARATGHRLRNLPMSPGAVLDALLAK
ncbi:MAG: xanthine dehydrogenase family protein molybdopterin-binding subunit [Dehalococcoidia bacterium]|jgi:CO/xanthine dehydrogenase Mo-binding subunit|nr:xanthine dehydrogenase family protein molybdopterin-binding subunit [Dehalococcoidia bacterium]MDP6228413.1 xanthine dehydrogenase family protein molybdopterin-binding subunit [Dehalococcoidia bacterium]MDP7083865.1 xanthine dehydrogenase family protein molybdopterin-binding subunit [Dehalococcoidia bacterium]MDP7201009.1 xanthine dehydrogenase family protein molybdopterin-binding subunit [Dehalococcoidia bacterium]MDP7510568.1 xanthine dehydrogenase family protein molybdopterin-binding subu